MAREFEFGADAFRDNEHERALTQEVLDRMNAGDDVGDMTSWELERVVEAAMTEGTNAAAREFARRASRQLDSIGAMDQFNAEDR